MTPPHETPYRKKLIEVAMPLDAINKASGREKSIRHGHPSTLHLYWARRPLAACRAVLFAQLVDDPSAHPDKFPTEEAQQQERERLFAIMQDLVIWENSTNEGVLNAARAEIMKSCGGSAPPIHDPFSGGGSIPLEAQRLGLTASGSDLNPVAVMIGKAMIEIPPLFKGGVPVHPKKPEKMHYHRAEGLAEDVKYYGGWMRSKAFARIGHLYPEIDLPSAQGGGSASVFAWIWVRTVPSPDPALGGVDVPLVKSFDLSTKKGKIWVEPIIEGKDYRFEIRSEAQGHEHHGLGGTVDRNGASCLISKAAMPLSYVREQAQGGKMKHRLMAIVAEGEPGRIYLSPDSRHEKTAFATDRPDISDIDLPKKALGYRIQAYGLKTYGDLFTDRQLMALKAFSELLPEVRKQIEKDALSAGMGADPTPLCDGGTGAKAYAEAVSIYLSFALNKCADSWSSFATWNILTQSIRGTFGRQSIPMIWDFAEGNPFSSSAGSWMAMVKWVGKSVNLLPAVSHSSVKNHDAQTIDYGSNTVISTDPPYYDNIGYADLSDFFLTWMKPALKSVYPELFSVMATPKAEELVATPYRHNSKDEAEKFFMNGMSTAIKNMADNTSATFPATIYYAFKQSEIEQEGISSAGWATFLEAVIKAGYAVIRTWPIRTERSARMNALGANALANSVVLVCRKRDSSLGSISRSEFLRQLTVELPRAVTELKAANIAPADMPQSAIGPGISIFSRYRAVLKPDDTPMTVKEALQLINRELGAEEGEYDPETSFALTWFEQYGFKATDFGEANSIANAKGISVETLVYAGIAKSGGGKFNLLARDELEEDWDPATDKRITIWECCQYLIHRMENEGEAEAAKLMKRMGHERAENAKQLAYELYDIAESKQKNASEANAYNGLIAAWHDLETTASGIRSTTSDTDKQATFI